MFSRIFQQSLLHMTCLRFAATLTETKHVENAFIYLKLNSMERLYDGFA